MKDIFLSGVTTSFGMILLFTIGAVLDQPGFGQLAFISTCLFIFFSVGYMFFKYRASRILPVIIIGLLFTYQARAQKPDTLLKDSVVLISVESLKIKDVTHVAYIMNKPGVHTVYVSKRGKRYIYVKAKSGRIYKKYLN